MSNKGNKGLGPQLHLILAGVLLVAAILLVTLVLVVKAKMKKDPEVSAPDPTPVAVMTVKKGRAVEEVRLVGKIEPVRDVTVAVEIGGRYTEMPSDVGELVKAGDVLVKIDDSLPRAAMRRAEVELSDAERELGRIKELLKKGAVSQSALDVARSRNEVAKAGVEEARAWLAKCKVTSPIDGRVEEKYIEVGEYALDGNRAFRVADLSTAKVVVYVPEKDIAAVSEGDELGFSVSARPDTEFKGEVSFVARAADGLNHAFRVELLTENKDALLKGGMIADVLLQRKTQEPVAEIPFMSVLPRKGEHIVFLHEEGRAVRRTVRIRAMVGESALISSGLEAGDQLVVQGQKFLKDGREVAVQEIPLEN